MTITLTKEKRRKIEKEGLKIIHFLILLSLFYSEDIFEENDENYYILVNELIVKGYCTECFNSEEEELFKITEKGRIFIETIENQ